MTSVNFVFRPSRREGHHPGTLCLRIIHDRQSKTIAMRGCSVYPEEWDRKKQLIVYPDRDRKRRIRLEEVEESLNAGLKLMESCIASLKKKGYYRVEDAAGLFRQMSSGNGLSGCAARLAREMEKEGQIRTAKAYLTVTRGLVRFNKGREIPLKQINATLIKDFEKFLREKGKAPNTISYYMRNLRAIYNKAVAANLIPPARGGSPFAGVYTGVTRTAKRALSREEIGGLQDLDLESLLKKNMPGTAAHTQLKHLFRTQRYFMFCFYARGMCFIDLANLKKKDFDGEDIKYNRKKTGQRIVVKVNRKMREIIESFREETAGSPYLFPIIRDWRKDHRLQYETGLRIQNGQLKALALMAGINKRVSTHVARHTWATLGKQANIPTHVISECLGHTSEKTTTIYLGELDFSLLDEANNKVISAVAPMVNRIPTAAP